MHPPVEELGPVLLDGAGEKVYLTKYWSWRGGEALKHLGRASSDPALKKSNMGWGGVWVGVILMPYFLASM